MTRFISASAAIFLLLSAVSLSAEFRNAHNGDIVDPVTLPAPGGTRQVPATGRWQLVVTVSPEGSKTQPVLEDLQSLRAAVDTAAYALLLVVVEASPSGISQLSLPPPIPVAFDPDRVWYARLGLFVFPATALFDPKGVLMWQRSGHSREWRDMVEDTLRLYVGLPPVERAHLEGPTASRDAEREYKMSIALVAAYRLAEARAALDSALALDSTFALAHLQLAVLYRMQGQSDSAGPAYRSALRFDSTQYRAWIGLADLALEAGQADTGLACAERALQGNDRSPDALKAKARALIMLERYAEAEALLDRVLLMSPGKADTRYYLGLVYEKTSRPDEALTAYREALRLLLGNSKD